MEVEEGKVYYHKDDINKSVYVIGFIRGMDWSMKKVIWSRIKISREGLNGFCSGKLYGGNEKTLMFEFYCDYIDYECMKYRRDDKLLDWIVSNS